MKPRQIHVGEIVLFESNNIKQKDWSLTKIEKNLMNKMASTNLIPQQITDSITLC